MRYQQKPEERLSADLAHHLANTTKRLQQRILSMDGQAGENVILTICLLMMIYVSFWLDQHVPKADIKSKQAAGDYPAFEIHLNGIRKVLELYGQLAESHWKGFIEARIRG